MEEVLKRVFSLLCLTLSAVAIPSQAQRRPVLPQIDEPHPYYYRELYLPQLTSGPSSLTWGPNSEELIYSMAGSLWRQALGSRDATQLTDGPGYDYEPDCSPGGKSVVYVSYQKDAMELWLLDLASGKTTQLTNGGAVNVEPRWSPDGKKLVWVSTQYQRAISRVPCGFQRWRAGKCSATDRRNEEFPAPLLLQRVRHGN